MASEKKHIIVTGGAGYIGSHTIVTLFEKGYVPIIIDDFRNAQKDVIERLEKIVQKKILYFPIACQNEEELIKIFSKYPIFGIIHFAADKAVNESVSVPLKYFKNNIESLVAILNVMQQFEVKRLVFSSSCTVYGEPQEIPVTENSPLSYLSPYGFTKLIGEQMIQQFVSSYPNLKVMILRYFNPIGAHESGLIGEEPGGIPNNLLPYITQTAFGIRKELTVFGGDYETPDGTCIRDFIHVQDLAEAHVDSLDYMEKSQNSTTILNVGTGKGTSVLELISIFEEVAEVELPYKIGPRRDGDVPSIYANSDKMVEVLNWKSKRTIKEAVASAWKFEQYIRKIRKSN